MPASGQITGPPQQPGHSPHDVDGSPAANLAAAALEPSRPHLIGVPRPSSRHHCASSRVDRPPERDHGVVNIGVDDRVEVEARELVDDRLKSFGESPTHTSIISNVCSETNP